MVSILIDQIQPYEGREKTQMWPREKKKKQPWKKRKTLPYGLKLRPVSLLYPSFYKLHHGLVFAQLLQKSPLFTRQAEQLPSFCLGICEWWMRSTPFNSILLGANLYKNWPIGAKRHQTPGRPIAYSESFYWFKGTRMTRSVKIGLYLGRVFE